MALDSDAANRISYRAATYQPIWNDGGGFRFVNVVGANVTVEFTGQRIRWLGYRYDDAGRGEVRIDGKLVATLDQYGPGRDLPFEWHIEGLTNENHTLSITLIGEKTAASRDRYLNIAGFQVLDRTK